MALQIWLPLMGDVHNQGLYDEMSFNNATAQVSASGCIGSCYSFTATTGSGIYSTPSNVETFLTKFVDNHSFSFCAFFKTTATVATPVAHITYGLRFFVGASTSFSMYNSPRNIAVNANTATNDGKWHHYAATYDLETNTMSIYVDGQLKNSRIYTDGATYTHSWTNYFYVGRDPNNSTANASYFYNGSVNDVRFYDHCLSAKEVKEISLGLAVHYKLETHVMKNIYSYPTFNTSSAGGGWNHWEPSGLNKGSYAQNTDKQYIFNKNNTYSHKVVNGSGSSYDYIMYQSPAYDTTIASGGCRTLVAIIKDENSQPITNAICHPGWNAPNNSIGPVSVWNEITLLGDGFYLCKCEGLCQTGSNNLIGIQVKSGHTIYISEVYLENYATKMGILPPYAESSDIMYDSSGYGRHGLHYSGTVFSVANSGNGRYDSAIENATGYIGKAEVNMPPLSAITFSWWANYKVFGAQTSGLFSTSNVGTDPIDYNTTACNMRDSYFDMCNTAGTCKRLSATGIELNKWHHYCITYDGATERFYVDGVEKSTIAQTGALKDFKYLYISYSKAGGVVRMCRGPVSDFRIYCTALSAADVKEMYETAASVDNKGNFHCYELKEV